MRVTANEATTIFDLAIRGLKEEHAACVARLGCVMSDPGREDEVKGYLLRIENINQAIVRLAGSRVAH